MIHHHADDVMLPRNRCSIFDCAGVMCPDHLYKALLTGSLYCPDCNQRGLVDKLQQTRTAEGCTIC
jgi:hypothetical protein